jgi:hypothetical protein
MDERRAWSIFGVEEEERRKMRRDEKRRATRVGESGRAGEGEGEVARGVERKRGRAGRRAASQHQRHRNTSN